MAWSGAMRKIAGHIRPLVIQRLRDIDEKKTLPVSYHGEFSESAC